MFLSASVKIITKRTSPLRTHEMNRPAAAPLTVVHVASGDLWAGAEVQLYYLVRALKDQGVRVYVVLLNTGVLETKLREAGIDTLILDERMRSSRQIFHALLDLWRRLQPDVVHTHRRKENVLGGISAWLTGTPSMRTAHGAQEIRPPWWHVPKHAFLALDWLSGCVQDRIVVVSNDLWQRLRNTFAPSKLDTVENGIDVAEVELHAREAVTLPGDTGRIKIALVGRIVAVKRVDIFLEMASRLEREDPHQFAFYIFGDGPLLTRHQAQARDLGLGTHLHFMGFRENVAAYLSKIDILVMTSDHEGLPITLLEAMCVRTPVLAHAVGGIPKLLDNGKAGQLVFDGGAQAYVDGIHRFANDPVSARVLAETAYARVSQLYSSARMADRYREIYRGLRK